MRHITLGKIDVIVLTVGIIAILIVLSTNKVFPDFAKGVFCMSVLAGCLHVALCVAMFRIAVRRSCLYKDYYDDMEMVTQQTRLDDNIAKSPFVAFVLYSDVGGGPCRAAFIIAGGLCFGLLSTLVGSAADNANTNPYFYWSSIGPMILSCLVYGVFLTLALIYDADACLVPDEAAIKRVADLKAEKECNPFLFPLDGQQLLPNSKCCFSEDLNGE